MATRTPTIVERQNVRIVTWTGLLNGDDGAPLEVFDYADVSVELAGTIGVGGTALWEGSNGGVAYAVMNNAQGAALSLTAAGLKQVVELARHQRPRVSAGDGTTNMTVIAYCRRAR